MGRDSTRGEKKDKGRISLFFRREETRNCTVHKLHTIRYFLLPLKLMFAACKCMYFYLSKALIGKR